MNIIRDPETGFYNSCHAGTHAVGPRRGLISFVTPHSHVIMRKYRDMGAEHMPIAFVFGVPPAYEIMANFSGLHMDIVGRDGDGRHHHGSRRRDGAVRDARPHRAGARPRSWSRAASSSTARFRVGEVTSPSMYHLPHYEELPEVEITAITMRGDRPIYRNHQTCPRHRPPDRCRGSATRRCCTTG